MAKAKKVKDVQVGDKYKVTKTVSVKQEDVNRIVLTFDDGTSMEFDKNADPALEIEE